MDALRWAKYFAAKEHGSQTYGSGLPYTHHLAAVEQVLRRFGWDETNGFIKLQAAWLHDLVEDTDVKLKTIEEMFGPEVAKLVWAVTNEDGPNRKVRAALTYPKIRETPGAVTLKLADRIANVEAGGKLVDMYKKEYEDFRRNLYTPGGEGCLMWEHLDKLMGREDV